MRRRSSSPARKPAESWAAACSIEEARGASVCTITSPPASPRPERPASCATIAKVRSSARKSGKRRVASASRIALSVTSGKSWPLATIWVPTRTALAASPNSARIRAWAPRCGGGVGVEAEDRHRREALAQQLLDPLGPRARPRQRRRGADRAGARRPFGVGAVVADEAARLAVDDQRDVAVGAAPVVPAGAAGEPGREAAPVDHHDRLAPRRADLLQRRPGVGVQRARARVDFAHVDDVDRRHAQAVDAARQLQAGELEPGLRARRRGPGDEDGAALARPGGGRRRGRRRSGRPPACRRGRAPRR